MIYRYDGHTNGDMLPHGERHAQSRFDRAVAYLDRAGPRPLGIEERTALQVTYAHSLREAMNGNKTHLNVVDTLIDPQRIAERKFPPNKTIWFVEVGGTNLRGGIMKTGPTGKPELVQLPGSETRPAFMEIELPKTKFQSVEEFAQIVAQQLSDIFTNQENTGTADISGNEHKKGIKPDALAIIFSFSGDPKHVTDPGKKGRNIDVAFGLHNIGAVHAKGFEFPGLEKEGVHVGQAIRSALEERYHIPDSLPYTVLNDTSALAVNKKLGLVVGTGANFAAQVRGRVLNTALATFHGAPTYPLFRRFDKRFAVPKLSSAFKEIGGKHLGEIMTLTVERLMARGILDKNLGLSRHFTSADMTNILNGDLGLHRANQLFFRTIDEETHQILQEIAKRLFTRSAQLMGTILATFISEFPDEFDTHEVISAQGSVLKEAPQYEETLLQTANSLLERIGKDISLSYQKEAGHMGITYAALSTLQEHEEEEAA